MTTWYPEKQTSARCIARSEQFYCHSREKRWQEVYFTLISQEATAMSVFLRHIPNGDDAIACESMSLIPKTRRHNIFWCCKKQSYCRGAMTAIRPSRDARRCNNQIFHAVHQRMTAISAVDREITATSVPWYVVLPEAMTTKVDCNKGCEMAPRNNQQKFIASRVRERLSAIRSQEGRWWAPFLCCIAMSKRRRIHFFRSIARERAKK